MKSRTSYFNKTVFRKDMTRFAPAWVLYTICLLMVMVLIRQNEPGIYFHRNLAQLIPIMSVFNLAYALLAAQLLFGDLYNSRMCNALHALPVTRDGWFLSHCAAGFSWSLIPTVLAALLALLLGTGSELPQGWQVTLWWLLGVNLQYLFFFGLAAFSALCVGNRFAQAVLYGIINFASVIAYWLVDTLYTPMLYGIQTKDEPFLRLSPVMWFASSEYVDVNWSRVDGHFTDTWFRLSDGWGYLAICALLGILLTAAACMLYRKRKLEFAGDFMAVKALEPVFLVVYSLIFAAVFYLFVSEILYLGALSYVYLVLGLTIGCFTGLMLLERTIRVFRKKSFLKFAALAAGFGLTLLVTWLDPLGLVTWMPDADEVAHVELSPSRSKYYTYNRVTLDEPEAIADVLKVHEYALAHRDYDEAGIGYFLTETGEEYYVNNQALSIHYYLTDGTVKSRYYTVNLEDEAGNILIPYFNTLDAIFRNYNGDQTLEGILKATQAITVGCTRYEGTEYSPDVDGYNVAITEPEDIRALMDAIMADCALGVMAQDWNFRPDPTADSCYWLDFDIGSQYENIVIYTDCVNTCSWLTEQGFISEEVEAKYPIIP